MREYTRAEAEVIAARMRAKAARRRQWHTDPATGEDVHEACCPQCNAPDEGWCRRCGHEVFLDEVEGAWFSFETGVVECELVPYEHEPEEER